MEHLGCGINQQSTYLCPHFLLLNCTVRHTAKQQQQLKVLILHIMKQNWNGRLILTS